jgi:membrane protease YdiL (CAAX protease family)
MGLFCPRIAGGAGWLTMLRPDLKWTPFTCVTEEAFFRGFLLAQLARGWSGSRYGLAAVAGFGYAMAYLRTGRIEAAILTHFALNALHFLAFTYPGLGG